MSILSKCQFSPWSVTSRLSCRVFNPHFGTSERNSEFGTFGFRTNSAFGRKFGFRINSVIRLNFGLGHALFLIFYRVFNPHFGTSELHSVIRFSDKNLNFGLGHALFLIFYLNQIRFRHVLPIKFVIITYTKNFFKISFLVKRNTCKTDRRLQLRVKMNCQRCRT